MLDLPNKLQLNVSLCVSSGVRNSVHLGNPVQLCNFAVLLTRVNSQSENIQQ